jgi:hypothetical protein
MVRERVGKTHALAFRLTLRKPGRSTWFLHERLVSAELLFSHNHIENNILSGDDRDRTGNLVVANQAQNAEKKTAQLLIL